MPTGPITTDTVPDYVVPKAERKPAEGTRVPLGESTPAPHSGPIKDLQNDAVK